MTDSPERDLARNRLPRLHLVTDDGVLRDPDFIRKADSLLAAGGSRVALHLRGHGLTGRDMWRLAEGCAASASRFGSWLLVNDRIDLALAVGARGVQLGQRSMRARDARRILTPEMVIGVSVHHPLEAREATSDGADFLLAGTLFPSPSHPEGAARGVAWLRRLTTLERPIIGIGGVGLDQVADVLATEAHGIAVLSAVWQAANPTTALEHFLAKLE